MENMDLNHLMDVWCVSEGLEAKRGLVSSFG